MRNGKQGKSIISWAEMEAQKNRPQGYGRFFDTDSEFSFLTINNLA